MINLTRRAPLVALRFDKEQNMGKYFLGWLLGVPAGLLILIYLFMHFF